MMEMISPYQDKLERMWYPGSPSIGDARRSKGVDWSAEKGASGS